jgi:putative PIN family toxin of toxin-antitoxin system
MKVFLDTNVWLSAAIFPGLCESLVMACAERDWLFTSPLVQQEAHQVLARKFPLQTDASALFDISWSEAQCIADVPDPVDDNDARLVAAAVAAGAELFVTGDKRVLEWAASGTMRIVSPRQAWIILFEPQLNH